MASKRKFFTYGEEDMKAAIAAVQKGMSKKAAAKQYNVPRYAIKIIKPRRYN